VVTVMPRVGTGGSGVMVASRPQSASAVIAAAAPPGTALGTASAALPQRLCVLWPHRIVVVHYFAGAIPADSVSTERAAVASTSTPRRATSWTMTPPVIPPAP
jgi:hypothetical protein